jgi:hypothetical protein
MPSIRLNLDLFPSPAMVVPDNTPDFGFQFGYGYSIR